MDDTTPERNAAPAVFAQTYFHGTKVQLNIGDLLQVGFQSNYTQYGQLNHIYMTSTLDAAIWGAELAAGEGQERIYLVEPTGAIEDDPNVTDKKFPGNPTMSYRSLYPLKIIGEVAKWQGHSAEQVRSMKEGLARLREQGADGIEN